MGPEEPEDQVICSEDVASEHWRDPAPSKASMGHSCHPSHWLTIAPCVPRVDVETQMLLYGPVTLQATLGPGAALTADKVQHPPTLSLLWHGALLHCLIELLIFVTLLQV